MAVIRIINKDCVDYLQGDAQRDFAGRDVILVSDPPFNVGYHYGEYKDNKNDDEYYEWIKCIAESHQFNGIVFIHYPESLYRIASKLGKFPNRIVSWVYNSNTPRQHRDIAFFDVKPEFSQVVQPYKNPNDSRIAERIENGIEGGRAYGKITDGTDITMYFWSDRTCYYVTKVIDEKRIEVRRYEVVADESKGCGPGHQNWLYIKDERIRPETWVSTRYGWRREVTYTPEWLARTEKWRVGMSGLTQAQLERIRSGKSIKKTYRLGVRVSFGVRAYLSGKTYRDIAKLAGLSLSTTYTALNGTMPSLDTFVRLANAVGCQVNLVCYGKDRE